MPGIVGVIGAASTQLGKTVVETMLGTMIHEPFYSSGTLQVEKLRLQVGWTALQESFADCMPGWNENRDICVIFSGEHFGDTSLFASLRAKGHQVSVENAAALVHLYEELGTRFLEQLNGCFNGLLVDLRQNKCILFNDRFGMHRVYYHENADGLYFASEAKALLKILPETRNLDYAGLGEFLTCGCVLQNRTLFSGISLLPSAACWTVSATGQITKSAFFDKSRWESHPELPLPYYYENLKEIFSRILPRYLNGKQRVGMSLTGGLDSRMIMAWSKRQPFAMPCFSHSGVYRDCHDARISRRVAEVCQQQHQLIRVGKDFFPEFPELARRSVYYTDGAMDVTGAVGLFVNRIARGIVPVRLTGNYGGEILRRLVAFRPTTILESVFEEQFLPYLHDAAVSYHDERKGNSLSFITFKQVPWHHYARYALEQSQLTIRSPYLDNELVALAFQGPAELSANRRLAAQLIVDGNPLLSAFPTDRGPLGRSGLLGKVQEAWQEFTFRAEYAYDYGMPQWLTRVDTSLQALHLERLFLGRHKYYHFRIWYRNQLSDYVRQMLLDPRTLSRPYLNSLHVEEMVKAHIEGRGNYTTEIHKLLTTEIIQRVLIEQR